MHYTYKPNSVCSRQIDFDIIGDVITNISFTGGCNGNLKAIAILCNGMTVSEIEKKLLGNDCNGKGTSCADQFAIAVREAFAASR
ncbi:MAG: TIGR03905 family TSCPD domain-containing protein [Lachnospiraceae bacterium]|nr:TIGR03905 family TSCPD domain-containing protein [Lachnospiraceae bacterium]